MRWLAVGALGCALGVAAGAFGAHALAARLEPKDLELWQTAARYWMYSSLGLALVGLGGERLSPASARAAGWLLLAGGLLFGLTVGGIALGAPRILGAITPLGGISMICGFLALARGAWLGRSPSDRA
ncbi:MAG: DUF423 domain-containing protein [Thermoanaerobaculia bacterium]